MTFEFNPQGTCSRKIIVETDGDIVTDVKFIGGCSGNTQGVAILSKGRTVDELISLLDGIKCGFKNTSCPDQFAKALKQMKKEQNC